MNAYSCSNISATGLFIVGANRSPKLASKVSRNQLASSFVTRYGDGSETNELNAEHKALIVREITTRKGTLKKSLPSDSTSPRAYYVWRMTRFHGGADMTMPMWANLITRKEPAEVMKELNLLVDELAIKHFGSDKRAAYRWGKALGHLP